MEGDRVTDRSGTAELGGQECSLEFWLRVQTVRCDDGRLDPAQDPSERKRLCSTHGPGNYLALAFHLESFQPLRRQRVDSRSHNVEIDRTRGW